MVIKRLPETITKDILLHAAQNRLMSCAKMFWDPNTTVQQMYEDLSCSMFSGDPEFDFPEQRGPAPIKYQYKDGSCSFMLDGIEVEVQDLRSMRKSPSFGEARYADICVLTISYNDESDVFMSHVIPNTWLYGSTSSEFDEGQEVHPEFINAAREYIKEHNITPEMQEVPDD